jgi:RHS repeat-associated protein
MEYFAFGETFVEEHSNTDRTPYLFNGKELDEETGLYYYGARYYDPRTSIFPSIDSYTEQYPGLSPYQYAANNPLIYVDINGDSIVSILRQGNEILIENSPLKEGGKNFTNTITLDAGVSHEDISDYSAGIVNDAMISIGDTEVGVSSGVRTPEQQANAMYKNLIKGTVEGEKKTYGAGGDKVIDVFVDMQAKIDKQGYVFNQHTPKEIKAAMTAKINELGPSHVSNHTVNDPRQLNVFDIKPSTVSNVKNFHNALIGDKRVKQVWSKINKPSEKAVHVEIRQLKNK